MNEKKLNIIEYFGSGRLDALFVIGVVYFGYALIVEGLSIGNMLDYNFGSFETVLANWKPFYSNSQPFAIVRATCSPLLLVWGKFTHGITLNPIAYMVMSCLVRVVFFILLARTAAIYTKSNTLGLLVGLVIVLAHPGAIGFSSSDMWSEVSFNHHHIAVILAILGLHCLLKKRFLASGIAFSLGFHFHPLNSLSYYGFIVAPYIFYAWGKNKKQLLYITVIPFVSIFYIALMPYYSSELSLTTSILSIADWYKSVLSTRMGIYDSSILFNLSRLVPFFTPLLLAQYALAREKWSYDQIGSLCVLAICIVLSCFELLHRSGIFFGRLSELLTVAACHRGLWVLLFFTVIGVFKGLSDKATSQDRQTLCLVCFACIHIIFSSMVTSVIVSGLALLAARSNNKNTLLLTVTALLTYSLYVAGSLGLFGQQLVTIVLFHNMVDFVAISLFLLYSIRDQGSMPPANLVATTIIIGALLFINTQMVSRHLSKAQQFLSLEDVSLVGLYGIMDDNIDKIRLAEDVLKATMPFRSQGTILVPLDIPTYLCITNGIPAYITNRDLIYVFKYKYALDYNRRLMALYGKKLEEIHNGDFYEITRELYKKITPEHLKAVMEKEGIAAAIVYSPMKGFETIFHNDLYYVVVPLNS